MKVEQFARVFQLIKTRTTREPPYQVDLILMHGERFGGMADPVDATGMVRIEVARVHTAHLSKPPAVVWIDVDSIQGITDDEVLTPPAA